MWSFHQIHALAILATYLLSTSVGAEQEDRFKRTLDVDVKNSAVAIQAKSAFKDSKYEKLKDSIKFDIKVNNGDGLKVDMHYKYDNTTEADRTKFSIKYTFVVQSIVEFAPQNISMGFQNGVDSITQELALKDWSSMVEGTEDVQGMEVRTFTTEAAIGSNGAPTKFVTKSYISTETLNDMDYSSNYVKFDFGIHNFPYVGQAGTTALALKTKIKGKFKTRSKTEGTTRTGKKDSFVKLETEDMDTIANSPVGRFSWVSTASMNVSNTSGAETINVTSSTNSEDDGVWYWFTFDTLDQPQIVAWDPEVGVQYDQSTTDTTNGCARATLSTFAMLVAMFLCMVQW